LDEGLKIQQPDPEPLIDLQFNRVRDQAGVLAAIPNQTQLIQRISVRSTPSSLRSGADAGWPRFELRVFGAMNR
jgi:hypothetical protein